ncbi:MAG TPA: hypothetical protein PLF01_05200 [Alphaproteobacteria bacterium]|nr:hypothetical protein [Alphaproteobacteria bacterium]
MLKKSLPALFVAGSALLSSGSANADDIKPLTDGNYYCTLTGTQDEGDPEPYRLYSIFDSETNKAVIRFSSVGNYGKPDTLTTAPLNGLGASVSGKTKVSINADGSDFIIVNGLAEKLTELWTDASLKLSAEITGRGTEVINQKIFKTDYRGNCEIEVISGNQVVGKARMDMGALKP